MATDKDNTDIDFIKLVLNGYSINPKEENLSSYFTRKFKDANANNYEAEDFFAGCFDVIRLFINDIERRHSERKADLYQMLTLTDDQSIKAGIKEEIANLQKNDFEAFLPYLTNNCFYGQLNATEIETILSAMISAKDGALQQRQKDADKSEKQTTTSTESQSETASGKQIPKLTLVEIGLMYSYFGKDAIGNIEHANQIAKEFGHNSGKKLRDNFNKYIRGTNERIPDFSHDDYATVKVSNHQQRFENILPFVEQHHPDYHNEIEQEYNTFCKKNKRSLKSQ